MSEQPAAPAPIAGYAVNLSLNPTLHPDGKLRNHVILHYGNTGVNIAMDLGPHESAEKFWDSFGPAIRQAIDKARQEDSGLTVAPSLPQIKPFTRNNGHRRP